MPDSTKQNVEAEIKTVGKNTLIYSIGNLAVKSVTILFIPLYTHFLTEYEVGIIVLLELLEVFYIAIAHSGTLNAIWRFFNPEKRQGTEKRFISSVVIFIFVSNLIFLTILIYSSPWFSKIYLSDINFSGLLKVLFVALFLGLSRTIAMTLFRLYEQAMRFIVFVFIDFVLLMLLTLTFVIRFDWGLWGIVLAKLGAAGIIFIITLICFFRNYRIEYHHKSVTRCLNFGFPLVFNSISILVLAMFDRYLVKELISVEASGIYGIAYKFGMIINMIFVTPFMHSWNPILFRLENTPEQELTYQKVALYYVQIGTLLWFIFNVVSKYLLKFTTPVEFHVGLVIIPWIAFSYLLFGLQNIFKAGALIGHKTIKLTIFAGISAFVNIILNLVMIPAYGMLGAAIATVFAYALMMVLVLQLSQQILRINWLWKKMILVMLLGAAFSCLSLFNLSNFHLTVAKDLLIVILMPLLMFIFGLISLKEVKRFIVSFKN